MKKLKFNYVRSTIIDLISVSKVDLDTKDDVVVMFNKGKKRPLVDIAIKEICEIFDDKYGVIPSAFVYFKSFPSKIKNNKNRHNIAGINHRYYHRDRMMDFALYPVVDGLGIERIWNFDYVDGESPIKNCSPEFIIVKKVGEEMELETIDNPCNVCTKITSCVSKGINVSTYNVSSCSKPSIDYSWNYYPGSDTADIIDADYMKDLEEVFDEK